jgi:amino acid permease
MIVSTVAMRGNIVSQTTLYAGATLQPMSTEGYISSNFTNLNTQGFPIKAMKLNIIICSFTVAV